MKLLSYTHTIVAAATAAHFQSEAEKTSPARAAVLVSYPPGSVLDIDDDAEAQHLLEVCAVEWIPAEHGGDPRAIAALMHRAPSGASQSLGGSHG